MGSSSTSPRVASVTSSAPPSRNSCFSSRAEAAVSRGRRRPPFLPSGWVQARRLEVRCEVQHSVRRHGEVHLGRAPGALVTHEAAVQGVVDVVGLGHVHHEVGGRAEPVPAGEEELLAGVKL